MFRCMCVCVCVHTHPTEVPPPCQGSFFFFFIEAIVPQGFDRLSGDLIALGVLSVQEEIPLTSRVKV